MSRSSYVCEQDFNKSHDYFDIDCVFCYYEKSLSENKELLKSAKLFALELAELKIEHGKVVAERDKLQEKLSRLTMQQAGIHPAPCAGHCEAKAYEIEIRGLKTLIDGGIRVHALKSTTRGTNVSLISATDATTLHNATLIIDQGVSL